ncbi:MAG: pre-peptidase, partial [Planctomycetaceae bacterium]
MTTLSLLAAGLLVCTTASAQLPQTRLTSVFPAGAKAGTSVDFTLAGGTDLDEVDRLLFSHPGISAVLKSPNVFTVTVKPDVPPGDHEVRAAGLYGLSNPRTFVVGARMEAIEVEPNDTADKPMPLEFEKVINGKSDRETDVDFYKFTGKKDQRILAVCEALRIDSRFAASLELFAGTRRIAHTKSGVRRDAVLDVTLPSDGEYILQVHDVTFRGGAELFYRLTLTTGPHLDYIMPPAGAPG